MRLKPKENWNQLAPGTPQDFLRTGTEGLAHPSRAKALELLTGMTSVLDVGCGTGVMFELIRMKRPELDYSGIDVTTSFVEAARTRFPEAAHRFHIGSLYDLASLPRSFDAVLCRHVLEHLPDYIPAVQQLYERVTRKLLLVFYLPPEPLRFRRKRDEHFERGFYTHTYDLGRFVHHLLNELTPAPSEVRIHPRQGTSDARYPWGDRENIIYEVLRPYVSGDAK